MPQPPHPVQALSNLPHGPAFRFLDELLELEPGVSATARWTLKGDEAFLAGHFPGHPLLPGVIMIEALAQLGGVLAQSARADRPLQDLRLTAVQRFKILGSITPGSTLRIQARLEAALPGLVQVAGDLRLEDGTLLAAGTVALSGLEQEAVSLIASQGRPAETGRA
jgi:3-hydroxymyristoyl/3-hydroxydecanoyl-(acyl carrier protein) dehydratase